MMHSDDIDALQLQPEPDKLYRYHRQQLSAMLDGELSPDQARFMLRRLEHDTELAACWERWQVCGDVLRGRHAALLPADFAANVARAIAGDAQAQDAVVQSAGQAARRGGLLRWGGSAALAASVAVVALLVGRQAQAPLEVETPAPARVAAADPVPKPAPAPTAPTFAPDAPAAAPLEGVTLAMAGASALAVAEAPRREERRSRGQSQRAAVTRERRRQEASAAPERMLAAAAPAPAAAAARPTFAAEAAPAPVARPWPQAGFGGGSAFAAGYASGSAAIGLEAPSFHPFEPRLEARLAMPLPALVWPQPAGALGPLPPADAD
ncbi:sigma-E factor negative regulatory protein [Luteimonas huabeiensis]|uniref:sigma-E factor negative regulatory protein n=1 Tax=Luteimonas huabeiensis TaxID=1244513 RepID=UPI000463653F|nr:sigma-E factor negative regulatory protein [Luteimonas huabeiensis]